MPRPHPLLRPSLAVHYHQIGHPLARTREPSVLPGVLRWQVRRLLMLGYVPLTLRELLLEGAHSGHMAVTFDDGHLSAVERGLPVLDDLQVPATLFVVAGAIGEAGEHLVGRGMLRRLAAAGMEIGSHSLSHARLTMLTPAAMREEIGSSKAVLEDLLGAPVVGFSYPYGAWDERVREAVIDAGYHYAVTGEPGALVAHDDRFTLPRLPLRWHTVGPLLRRSIARAEARFVLPARAALR